MKILDKLYKKVVAYLTNLCYSIFRIGSFRVVLMKRGRYSAMEIAKWFLWKNKVEQLENVTEYDDYEVYENLTHLKLQKLLYYAQGSFLAYANAPLFNDKIEAWTHGPVVREVYKEFKKYGRDDIIEDFDEEDLKKVKEIEEDEDASMILNLVYENFGGYTAWQLREMTHIQNGPWERTVSEKGMDKEISKDLMKDYFKENILSSV